MEEDLQDAGQEKNERGKSVDIPNAEFARIAASARLYEALKDDTGPSNSEKFVQDSMKTAGGRRLLIAGEGLRQLPDGIVNGVAYNWNHPDEFALKMSVAGLIGVAMRVGLPRTGALKATVGLVMGGMMVKDAAKPVYEALSFAEQAKDERSVKLAGKHMANGLGLFTVDALPGLLVGAAGEKVTGFGLNRFKAGRNFEAWKEQLYNGKPANALGARFDQTAMRLGDHLLGAKPTPDAPALSHERKIAIIRDAVKAHNSVPGEGRPQPLAPTHPEVAEIQRHIEQDAHINRERMHRNVMPDLLDDLLAGTEHGRKNTAGNLQRQDMRRTHGQGIMRSIPPDEGTNTGTAGDAIPGSKGHGTTDNPSKDRSSGGEVNAEKSGNENGNIAESGNEVSKIKAGGRPAHEVIPANIVGDMAVTVREVTARVDKTDMQLADIRESIQSPLTMTMREGKPPLDKGHWDNNKALISLADGITTPEAYQQVGWLLEHHRVANSQMGLSQTVPEVAVLNQYSRSVHKAFIDRLAKDGIDINDITRGTNSPIFLVFDSQGGGPYTIPAIKGVTDTAVIVLPREYQSILGAHVAGVYPHELGHDIIYGDILRFPDNLRRDVLTDKVVKAAMQDANIADTAIEIPGHGEMPKSEFLVKVLLAQANENTADMFGTAIDPNTGLSLAALLSALRKPPAGSPRKTPGQLETRSMYGQELAEAGNELGIEVHGIDAWRLKLSAQVLRELGRGNKRINDYADSLVTLSESVRRPGDKYVWASMDHKGKFVEIPMNELDAIIPNIVKAQLDTPLDALGGRSFRSVLPDMKEVFPRIDDLATEMAANARSGKPDIADFDKSSYRIEDVFSASLLGWAKALSDNPASGRKNFIAPESLMNNIEILRKNLTERYLDEDYVINIPSRPLIPPDASAAQAIGGGLRFAGGQSLKKLPQARQSLGWLGEKMAVPGTTYKATSLLGQHLLEQRQLARQMLLGVQKSQPQQRAGI